MTDPAPSRSSWKDTAVRVASAVVAAPLLIGCLYVGGALFAGVMLLIALVAQDEVYRLITAGSGLRPRKLLGFLLAIGIALWGKVPYVEEFLVVVVLLLLVDVVFIRPADQPLPIVAATVFGVIYPTYCLLFVVRLRDAEGLPDGAAFFLTLSLFLMIWATDTFAYFSGRAFGKHPLAPSISPKKTWEGSIGGALGAVVVAVGFKLTVLDFIAWEHLLVVALICGVLSQLGDLIESRFKRSVNVKDSGAILPGHGGLLDRFDAMLLAAPLVYFYLADIAQLFG